MAIKVRDVIHCQVARDIDRETFGRLHKMAHYTALFDRDAQGRVIWNEDQEFPYLETAADRDFQRLQRGEHLYWELPKPEEAEV